MVMARNFFRFAAFCSVPRSGGAFRGAPRAALRGVAMRASEPSASESAPTPLLNLYSLDEAELSALLREWKQPGFRASQLRSWVYERGVTEYDSMLNLPKALRAKLAEHTSLGSLDVAHQQESRDGTRKRLWRCADGALIESVLMPYDDARRTACISSQVGCAMGCTFCATGQMGFVRDLSAAEIFEQAARFSAELQAKGERLSNVVFMGMGEPFRNYDNVLVAARRIMSDLGIGARRITISTVGVVPSIRRFADECEASGLEIKLAISLHEASDARRSKIMPVNRRHDIAELIDACRYYVAQSGRRISFEWALIDGHNDSEEAAAELARLLSGLKCHVNLIPLNPTRGFGGRPAALPSAQRFVDVLGRKGIPATVRVRRGIDIDAGCGQLTSKFAEEQEAAAAAAGAAA